MIDSYEQQKRFYEDQERQQMLRQYSGLLGTGGTTTNTLMFDGGAAIAGMAPTNEPNKKLLLLEDLS